MNANKRRSIESEILELRKCILLNEYYLKVLKPGSEKYAYQELLLGEHKLQISDLEKQLVESCSQSSEH